LGRNEERLPPYHGSPKLPAYAPKFNLGVRSAEVLGRSGSAAVFNCGVPKRRDH